jgi:hypothetical protein
MDTITEDYTALVIKNMNSSNKLEDKFNITYYRDNGEDNLYMYQVNSE